MLGEAGNKRTKAEKGHEHRGQPREGPGRCAPAGNPLPQRAQTPLGDTGVFGVFFRFFFFYVDHF